MARGRSDIVITFDDSVLGRLSEEVQAISDDTNIPDLVEKIVLDYLGIEFIDPCDYCGKHPWNGGPHALCRKNYDKMEEEAEKGILTWQS